MAVNYEDSRFKNVKAEEKQAISNTENQYNELINNSNSYYQEMIDSSKEYADKQTEIQNQNTDFAIEKINQQKEQAEKQYTKEQKGAYADYQRATGQYGVNAEQLASQGLNQAGYSESVRTNMFNTYQNRYMAARESYTQAILNYDNAIKEAQLANNAALAQIAYEALQKQLELSLQGFQYKNQLVLQKLEAVNAEKDRYYQRWKDVQSQINTENALAEQIRQYNETLAFQKQKAKQEQANWEKEYALSRAKVYSSGSSGGGGGGNTTWKDGGDGNNTQWQENNTQQQEGKLSQAGIKHKQTALTILNSRTGSKEQSARFAVNYLYDAYNRGGLKGKDNDLRIIMKDLGLD